MAGTIGIKSECSGCGLVFAGVRAFDKHRTGSFDKRTRRCRQPHELEALGMVINDRGHWAIPVPENKPNYWREKHDRAEKSVTL